MSTKIKLVYNLEYIYKLFMFRTWHKYSEHIIKSFTYKNLFRTHMLPETHGS